MFWTEFAADGSAYVYGAHSGDYGATFSSPVPVSASNPNCPDTFGVPTSNDLTNFGQVRATSSSMPAPTQFGGKAGGQFNGDYVWLSAGEDTAYPIWSDTRAQDLFPCPNNGTPGNPPQLRGSTETNGLVANDEETFMATVDVPTAHRRHRRW